MTKEVFPSLSIENYLQNNISSKKKILISLSCGLDSTVLFDLIIKSKYFKNKNIYYLIFDHQKRSEGKDEIKQFINNYQLANKNVFIKKLFFKNKLIGFQENLDLLDMISYTNFQKKEVLKIFF